MERAKILARLIEEKGYSRRAFAEHIGLPPTTLQSMLNRGVGGAAIDNVLKVTKGLGITIDELEKMVENEARGGNDNPEETKLSPAELAEFEAFINNPEHGVFFKDYLEAPEERKRDLQKVWEIIKRAAESDQTEEK
ncbi:helix-turn-helix domain-containing protein [Paenibacillus zanthoxyli]|uniref:helix-turn-helix domain-containing protein n=1 Tax=Paenibacillus zanthoxyli TaxID=369399 RepID=UPI00046FF2DB|nr:helix-turn-helix transcriptional regulator [Paenibacillus zanthoxyli]